MVTVMILCLPFAGCVNLDKLLQLCEPQFSHVYLPRLCRKEKRTRVHMAYTESSEKHQATFIKKKNILHFNACLRQMFLIHLFTRTESLVLLAVASDRFVAISNPLRGTTIRTHARITQVGSAVITRGTVTLTPLVLLLRGLSFCCGHVLYHSHCFHPEVTKLSCSDTKVNSALGLTAMISAAGVDSVFILLSCVLIVCSVLNIASPVERKKAFSACVSHITAVAISYIPLISLSFLHRLGKCAPPCVSTLIANLYLLVPPVMKLIIYSVKTGQIQKAMLKLLCCKRTHI
ncbi:PREDICTED: LOW QUALITY PROTEIN: olfactory receptor 51F2-like [Miniopterus natalensis]|uniref:LOW QUALITY PROTEIN: olfactory receptor 51F2-like n=1 Tax=Miniopterus natalensis TaxID=291302 RepID=UPI0007A6CF53|nr:PREDICTED: LOW QUALITY PROTEIN: olfactory receptor 51F2-like [Miniopterus natalensis]